MDQKTTHNGARGTKPTEYYHLTQQDCTSQCSFLAQSHCSYQTHFQLQQAAEFSKKVLLNPSYISCPDPNSILTKLAGS